MSRKMVEIAVRQNEVPVKELSVQEEKRLEQLENVVVENFKTFIQVGRALAEIRDRKLYRKKAMTFERYCKELFDIAKSRAYELINAADVIENVRNCGQNDDVDLSSFFVNESQIRPLTKLRPEQQVSVCRAAIESAPNGRMTATHVKKVVKEYLGEKIQKTVRTAQEKVIQASSPEFSEAFEKFSWQIIKERGSNYKFTSRGEIVKCLDQLRADLAEDGEFIDDPVFHGGGDDMNKLERAGFSLFRMDRASMSIKRRSENGGWQKHSGAYETIKEMEAAFKDLLQDDMHLRG
ncbi:hypothetical protein [Desulfopila inferna]|uniref:hypothetical protein n=1 Tax=Desulfopila inferna TaxID=468528 RepID=UPI0019642E8B|nr:hypothetical protein [Desulfopila inferna]MBM9605940.1 hypothetical protein [Desulfopila inferna]